MIRKIHHITVAVADLDAAVKVYREVLGVEPIMREHTPHNLRWAIFPLGDSEIQLCQNPREPAALTPEQAENPVSRRYHDFIKNHGEGFHHVALEVDRLSDTLAGINTSTVTIAGKPIEDAKPLIEPRARLVFFEPSGLNGLPMERIQIDKADADGRR